MPIVAFVIFYKYVGDALGIRIILLYAVSSILINAAYILTKRLWLYDSLTLIEYLIFTWFVFLSLKRKGAKRAILFTGAAYILFFFLFKFLFRGKYDFDSIPIGIEAIVVLSFSFYYLYERMNDTTTLFIYNTYPFWIILGMVLYLAGCFFIYIFTDYLRHQGDDQMLDRLWTVTNVFSIIKNVLFAIAILIHAKPPKEATRYQLDMTSLN